ncbi:MAG: M48 family metalloprotease [Candidatus Symbiobacter sp.]|nr:M48 family metalloprotease [Candidatus Symbiobacter sp.]
MNHTILFIATVIRRNWRGVWLAVGLLGAVLVAGATNAQQLSMLRDTEIETDLRAMATPIWQAAGIDPKAVTIYIVNDPSLNAFVAAGQKLFLHSGLILRTENAGQLIGVIAHETGHMAGGHLLRQTEAVNSAMATSLLSILAGGAAAIVTKDPSALAAGAMASQTLGARQYLAFSRTIEAQADHAGMAYLNNSNQSAKGFWQFMQILWQQDSQHMSPDPYFLTHPLSSVRMEEIQAFVKDHPGKPDVADARFNETHARMRAKLAGFLLPLAEVNRRYPATDTSLAARYARAIAQYRLPDVPGALHIIDDMIRDEPNNPYFYELKAQILFDNGHVAEALPTWQQAVKLKPDAPLLRVDYVRAMIELGDPQRYDEGLAQLNEAAKIEENDAMLWRLYGIIYGTQGKEGLASGALAQGALLEQRFRDAERLSDRALKLLPYGSPAWLRADDTLTQARRLRNGGG